MDGCSPTTCGSSPSTPRASTPVKHGAQAVVGDARAVRGGAGRGAGRLVAPTARGAVRAGSQRALWDAHVDGAAQGRRARGVADLRAGRRRRERRQWRGRLGARVVRRLPRRAARRVADGRDARSPGVTSGATMDLEYGFSCMGYEVAGPWGAAMARATTHPDGLVTALLGDGSYLMLNSELYSAALSGHPFVAVVCDNGGYAVIHRLQTGQGADGFNNLLDDCRRPGSRGGSAGRLRRAAASPAATSSGRAGRLRSKTWLTAYAGATAAVSPGADPRRGVPHLIRRRGPRPGRGGRSGCPRGLSGRASYDEEKPRQLRWV